MSVKPSILIFDDEPGVRTALSGVLRDEGYDVEAVSSGEDCLERVTRAAFDLVHAGSGVEFEAGELASVAGLGRAPHPGTEEGAGVLALVDHPAREAEGGEDGFN